MRRSTDHILSSHGGNLPRPVKLDVLLAKADDHRAEIDEQLPLAVQWVVDKQIACGVDIVNDGEYVKAANMGHYVGYIQARITGFGQRERPEGLAPKRAFVAERDRRDFPGFYESGLWFAGSGGPVRPGFSKPGVVPQPSKTEAICDGPVTYIGQEAIQKDIAALKKALVGKDGADGFIAALGPLSLGAGTRNLHYRDERDYMMAVAATMREEYKAITDAGLIVQIDEPEFATAWMFYPDWSVEEYRDYLRFCVEVINHALEGLPEEQVRFHMCWGSGHRPHVNDIGFEHIADLMLMINAQTYTFEASNPRHAHEYRVFETLKLPDGKILAPGVVGHYTDLVEHPELVAERLVNFAKLVGMENLHAGTDCGIGSRVGHEEIVWAKLSAMAEGCRIASKRLKS
ncbi:MULTISPECIES: cobalamin-independent methionine synthase II family protein [unclassified Sphingobium]|uniref:cobalamin-independent methionine synthase II family protein n=1 Tax=unclassified Sphingobium TaxID=2611147 RepID=UPI00222535D4|nr:MULTISPECIES: cobalamin-independent methionine synthase II family protein [unclassified Sphingobium]MCW2394159.1 5-methyltetrahydropteroyltriglutamate--homocysteine methyltransferase [Sphingobium sp. B8D3B]MCW2417673.1 5-methyltetrahydropteroyltriglutamate--homocysteine methyltransferase [Sphingobium sp. B8D3C]